jgi:hypothetical protein
MSVDSSFSDDLAYVPQSRTEQSTAVARVRTDGLRGLPPLVLGAAALVIGGGVIAAIATGANIILSLLIGYCALTSTIACLRTPAGTAQSQPPETIDLSPVPHDTTAAWKLVSTFTISDASRLLCSVEPGAAATQESIAWGRALIDAIKGGDLAVAPKAGIAQAAIERENPHYMTEITREALRAWVDQKGSAPAFLQN